MSDTTDPSVGDRVDQAVQAVKDELNPKIDALQAKVDELSARVDAFQGQAAAPVEGTPTAPPPASV